MHFGNDFKHTLNRIDVRLGILVIRRRTFMQTIVTSRKSLRRWICNSTVRDGPRLDASGDSVAIKFRRCFIYNQSLSQDRSFGNVFTFLKKKTPKNEHLAHHEPVFTRTQRYTYVHHQSSIIVTATNGFYRVLFL